MKKLFIYLTSVLFMCSFSVYAGGGGGSRGGGGGFSRGMGSGTMSQSRILNQYKTQNSYNRTTEQGTAKKTRTRTSSGNWSSM